MSYLCVINPSEPCSTMPQNPAMEFKYPLDTFQQHAVAAISRDENVLVTAKTGSGKTFVGEYQIAHSLRKGGRVFYTTPIKSLSNQKFHDLKSEFPHASVGIMTGDMKFCPDAQIVIMTTEILRNLLFKQGSSTQSLGITANLSLDSLDAVVFDECHYINDRDRGAVWEETMILLPREINLVLLSATIESPELFASWLGELKKKPIHLISTQFRVVPLQHAVYQREEILTVMDNREKFYGDVYRNWLRWREADAKAGDKHKEKVAERRGGGYEAPVVQRGDSIKAYKHQMNELIARLQETGLLPALFFVFSRKNCEKYAGNVEHTLLDSSETAAVKHIIRFHLHRYGDTVAKLPQYHTLAALLERGIAFHHSGLIPVLKEIVEILFGRGYVKLLFATETFAVGINMPTKTVVFTSFRKYDDESQGLRMLNTDEYIQMAGRAGRRGKDDKGLVLYMPDRAPEDMETVRRMMTGSRCTFQSRMTFHYDFLLKTLQSGNLDWIDLLHKSYWFQRHRLYVEEVEGDIKKAEAAAAAGLTEAEVADMTLYDSLNQRLKESVNAAKKEAQKALGQWNNGHQGPRWHLLQKELWPQQKKAAAEVAQLRIELAVAANPADGVWPSLDALAGMGLLIAPVDRAAPTLTALGVMATEINEGHSVLMAQLYKSGILEHEAPDVIMAVLAGFIIEGKVDPVPLESLDIPRQVVVALKAVKGMAAEAQRIEGAVGARRPKESYWAVSSMWVEPVWRWLGGESLQQLCEDYETYEGNMIRIFMKLANILEEWRSLAMYCEHAEMLEKMRDFEREILKNVVICDSLYLGI